MITHRFRPIMWAGGAAIAATGLYLISLQVASEHKRLEEVNNKILSTQHDIRLLQTEISARANLRQLEKWNGESLALETPRASQYLPNGAALDHFDLASLKGKGDTPMAAMAEVTSDGRAPVQEQVKALPSAQNATSQPAAPKTVAKAAPPARVAMLEDALAQITERRNKP